jgi:hypothetical protein
MGAVAEGARTLFNPFFAVSDNAGSCFLARGLLRDSDAVLLNGDTVFEPASPAPGAPGAGSADHGHDRPQAGLRRRRHEGVGEGDAAAGDR